MTAASGEAVLLVDDGFDGDDPCHAVLGELPADRTAVLLVTLAGPRRDLFAEWRREARGTPAARAIVNAGVGGRGAPETEEDVFVSTVSHPFNLTRLGVEIMRALEHLQEEAPAAQIVVCFGPLSALLQYADVNQAFQFLHVLTGRFAAADAAFYAHLDSAALDEQTIATLRMAFDRVIE